MASPAPTHGLKNLSLDETYLLVAAIDFGTTFSGYAFSFKSTQDDICMNKNWGASLSCESYKTPTCVLTKPGGEFQSFGYDAEDDFNQLEDNIGGPDGYNLYRNFKMLLHKQGAKLNSAVISTSGHVTLAVDIFAMALKYLKDHMLNVIKRSVKTEITMDYVRWVLTVPAIWSDESKRFMREAAFKGGLISDVTSKKLLIALEPEAASIYCRGLEIDHFQTGSEQMENTKFKTGDKILIIDAGGGTIDITAHELLISGQVKEISPPSGGPWGGTKVDEKFLSLICQIVGVDFINKFKQDFPQQWFNFKINFEKAKKGCEQGGKSLRIAMPYSFESELLKMKKKGLNEFVEALNDTNVTFKNGFLSLKNNKVQGLFQEVISNIVSHVKDKMKDKILKEVKYMFLVGGFGENKFLQQSITETFSREMTVLSPTESQLAIIKGAVAFGHNPDNVGIRIAKYTYGCKCTRNFDEEKHDPQRLVIENGKRQCEVCFYSFVQKDEAVDLGEKRIFNFCSTDNESSVAFVIFRTSEKHADYIDEPHMIEVGSLLLENPSQLNDRKLQAHVTFGGTEILIQAVEVHEDKAIPVEKSIGIFEFNSE